MAGRLKNEPLWQVQAVVPHAAEEPAAAAFEQALGVFPSSYAEPEGETVQLSVYLPAREKPSRGPCVTLRDQLSRITGKATAVRLSRLADRNWRESWKHHFRPISIGNRLLLRPSWSRRKAKPGQTVVVLDPGLSFGTGHHPTTGFCLRELVARREPATHQSFLDLGTGSGILAIAAAKMGYDPVRAMDHDPDCVRVALGNARRNRMADRLTVRLGDVMRLSTRPRRRHDVVCANLLAPLLVAQAGAIAAHVRPGGWLIVAGILAREFPSVDQPLVALGGVLVAQHAEAEWHSATYRFLT